MTETVARACLIATLAMPAGLAAQQPPSSAMKPDVLTLTGCLDRAPNGTYQLLHASRDAAGPGGATGTSGSAATPPASSARGTSSPAPREDAPWILKSPTDLAPHVGHKVQITGRPSATRPSSDDAATTTPPTTTSTGARVKDPGEAERSLDVSGVRMLARACP